MFDINFARCYKPAIVDRGRKCRWLLDLADNLRGVQKITGPRNKRTITMAAKRGLGISTSPLSPRRLPGACWRSDFICSTHPRTDQPFAADSRPRVDTPSGMFDASWACAAQRMTCKQEHRTVNGGMVVASRISGAKCHEEEYKWLWRLDEAPSSRRWNTGCLRSPRIRGFI